MASILWKPSKQRRAQVYLIGAAIQRENGSYFLDCITYAIVRADSAREALAKALRSGALNRTVIDAWWDDTRLPAVIDITYGPPATPSCSEREAPFGPELGGPLYYIHA